MGDVYSINKDGSAIALRIVRCKSEDTELQALLENNLDLLPGEQIDPENPRRWIMIRREMPVPDPTTGANRWNVDFFLADQDAIPTFVECKRHDDSRARREVVGQMLDYVANGHHYWKASEIMEFAQQSASKQGRTIETAIASLGPSLVENIEVYFKEVETNLREGNVRMVFVLEDSSYELRSIVEFLQNQMQRVDVFLVEIRQYEVAGQRIVVPTLFGYTERAHRAKQDATQPRISGGRRVWNRESFMEDAQTKSTMAQLDSIKRVLSTAETRSWDIKWGTGKENGSLSVRIPTIAKRSLCTIYSNGLLTLNFGWLHDTTVEEEARDLMAQFAKKQLAFELPSNYKEKYPSFAPDVWCPKVDNFIEFLVAIGAGV
jgi:hypothetical protein